MIDKLFKTSVARRTVIEQLRIKQTILWCRQRLVASGVAADSLRSPQLEPVNITLRGALLEGMTAEQIEAHRESVVLELGRRRAQLLGQPIQFEVEGGRILAFDLEATFFDEVPAEVTDGFFDSEDLPPWDTWITYGFYSKRKRNVLLSWVPVEFETMVERAVQASFADAYEWVALNSI